MPQTRWISLCLSILLYGLCVLQSDVQAAPASETAMLLKNVILFISDGCGYNHVEAASYYRSGTPDSFSFQQFPLQIGMSTYNIHGSYDPETACTSMTYVQNNPTESGASGAAIACGRKTYSGAIGMIGHSSADAVRARSVVEHAEWQGMATGVATSVQFSHATAASFAAHNVSRYNYEAIAREMLTSSTLDVIIGCGHPGFDNDGQTTASVEFKYAGGEETWLALLAGELAVSDADRDHQPDAWSLVESRDDFQSLAAGQNLPKRLLGIPQTHLTLQQRRSGGNVQVPYADALTTSVPTLSEITMAAINVLEQDTDGFFLMVEGGAVDWASHSNQSGRMIEEELEFADAVSSAVVWVADHGGWEQTLIVVTGDHECGYLTGPANSGTVEEQLQIVGGAPGEVPQMQWRLTAHTNSLVPLYANGPESVLQQLLDMADEEDPIRGSYIDNAELGAALIDIIPLKPPTAATITIW
ncbi:alkaline phosphatase [Candidatus Sumerlaeota bacterium]|nr:alkaline phosphatase [Candidatus Sumerlaeota bacterium]